MSDAVPPEIRNGFIKKVYTLLTLMLVVTTVVAFPFQLLSVEQVRQNFALLQVLMISSLAITLCMTCCCLSMMRSYPTNYIFLVISIFCASCNMWINLIYASLGAVLFSFYIVYDTQLIVGGQHKKHEYSIDDYAFAALSLYMDVINLFLMILSLFGSRK